MLPFRRLTRTDICRSLHLDISFARLRRIRLAATPAPSVSPAIQTPFLGRATPEPLPVRHMAPGYLAGRNFVVPLPVATPFAQSGQDLLP